jgi:cysteine desulfurase
MRRYYLDNNATTLLDPNVRAGMDAFLASPAGNPSSLHAEGRRARGEIDAARDSLAAWLKGRPSEIIFTSGGTESCNLAILGLARAHASRGRHLITVKTEHHAVLHAFRFLEAQENFEVTYLDVDCEGLIDLGELAAAIRPNTTLVSIMSANNETGVCQPMPEIGEICSQRGVLFHIDAAQSIGKIPLDLAAWRVSSLSLAAHKFHGPFGAGLLWLRQGIPINRIMEGGSHENERRPGTENTAAIIGLAEAARRHGSLNIPEAQRQFKWIEAMWRGLEPLGGVRRNGHAQLRVPNTLNVSFHGLSGEDLLIALDLAGLAVSSGSACLVGSIQPSHVLAAMEVPADWAAATVRFSIGPHIQGADLDEILRRVKKVVNHQRELRGWKTELVRKPLPQEEISWA